MKSKRKIIIVLGIILVIVVMVSLGRSVLSFVIVNQYHKSGKVPFEHGNAALLTYAGSEVQKLKMETGEAVIYSISSSPFNFKNECRFGKNDMCVLVWKKSGGYVEFLRLFTVPDQELKGVSKYATSQPQIVEVDHSEYVPGSRSSTNDRISFIHPSVTNVENVDGLIVESGEIWEGSSTIYEYSKRSRQSSTPMVTYNVSSDDNYKITLKSHTLLDEVTVSSEGENTRIIWVRYSYDNPADIENRKLIPSMKESYTIPFVEFDDISIDWLDGIFGIRPILNDLTGERLWPKVQ